MSDVAKHIIYFGRVQGVGFRFTAQRIASHYELTGFVRNLTNETVEILVQGQADNVSCCLRDITESFAGYIRDAKTEDTTPDARYNRFTITF